jgi:ABC-type glutathione transport system ATPase component
VNDLGVDASAYLKPVLLKRKGVTLGLWGEAGIGKSYSVQQLRKTLPCQSESFHATTPLTRLPKRFPNPKS